VKGHTIEAFRVTLAIVVVSPSGGADDEPMAIGSERHCLDYCCDNRTWIRGVAVPLGRNGPNLQWQMSTW
jgi:hypothetical protein